MAKISLPPHGERRCSAPGQPRETIVAPVLAADAMVHKEQPVGIVFGFDRLQARVIRSPERALPAALRFPRAPITSPRLRERSEAARGFRVRGGGARLRYRFAQPKRS